MKNRRKFLQQVATLSIGGSLLSNTSWAHALMMRKSIPAPGIQLFTLIRDMEMDAIGTLKKVAEAGYKNIETAFTKPGSFYGNKPKEFKNIVHDMGMEWRSHHVVGSPMKPPPNYKVPMGPDGKPVSFPPMKTLKDNAQELIDLVAEAGIPYIVCASINIETGDDIKYSAEILHKSALLAKQAGLQFVYHNHSSEFDTTDGIVSYDYFTSQIPIDLLKLELDLGWVFKAGRNPVDIFKNNKGRFPLLHVKDMTSVGDIVPFGTGVYDFRGTFENLDLAGVKYFFIEQDFPKNPFEDIVTSVTNFNKFKMSL